jgi:hypothetical protein
VVLGRRHVWLPVPDRSGGHGALKRSPWGLLWPTMFEPVPKRTAPDLELVAPLLMRNVVADHEAKEQIIRQSTSDWVIVRPPRLTNGAA